MELFFLINNTLTNHIYKFRVDLIGNLLTIQSPVVRKKNETNKNKQEKECRFHFASGADLWSRNVLLKKII